MANILLAPEDFSNVAWINSLSIDEQAQGTAPDGTNTLNKITDDSSTGVGAVYMRQNLTMPTHGEWWFAIFAKKDQLDLLAIQNAAYDNAGITYFNLTTGAVGTTAAGHAATITDYGDGFYRCAIGFTTTTDKAGHFRLYVPEIDGITTADLDGTSSIFMWGGSLNTGTEPEPYTSVAGFTLGAASSDRLVASVTNDVTRNITRGVTEGW